MSAVTQAHKLYDAISEAHQRAFALNVERAGKLGASLTAELEAHLLRGCELAAGLTAALRAEDDQ